MRLSCLKASLAIVAVTVACHDSTAPPQAVSRLYLLESINGQPLPSELNSGGGDTTTVFWATLTLDAAANAVTVEHMRHVYQAYPADEFTYTARYEYRITADSIEVGSFKPCPPFALCALNRIGKLSDSTLTLSYGGSPPLGPVFTYHLAQTY